MKALFPKMPDQVIEIWIAHGVDAYGWPFESVDQSLIGTTWDGFFGRRSLAFWANADWTLISLRVEEAIFHPDTVNRVRWIADNCTLGLKTPTTNVENTQKRFWTAASFIRANGRLPCPVVATTSAEGIDIMDGNHRIAALVALGYDKTFSFPAWLGETRN